MRLVETEMLPLGGGGIHVRDGGLREDEHGPSPKGDRAVYFRLDRTLTAGRRRDL
jgi:hypothetical protein